MPDKPKDRPSYVIGHKKPPKATQFKSGQSGNPGGRPKGSKNFATVIDKELNSRIPITENGERKRITKREAVAKQVVNKAAAGDPKAIPILLNETRYHESLQNTDLTQPEDVDPEDRMVMKGILNRWRQMEKASAEPVAHTEPLRE